MKVEAEEENILGVKKKNLGSTFSLLPPASLIWASVSTSVKTNLKSKINLMALANRASHLSNSMLTRQLPGHNLQKSSSIGKKVSAFQNP